MLILWLKHFFVSLFFISVLVFSFYRIFFSSQAVFILRVFFLSRSVAYAAAKCFLSLVCVYMKKCSLCGFWLVAVIWKFLYGYFSCWKISDTNTYCKSLFGDGENVVIFQIFLQCFYYDEKQPKQRSRTRNKIDSNEIHSIFFIVFACQWSYKFHRMLVFITLDKLFVRLFGCRCCCLNGSSCN